MVARFLAELTRPNRLARQISLIFKDSVCLENMTQLVVALLGEHLIPDQALGHVQKLEAVTADQLAVGDECVILLLSILLRLFDNILCCLYVFLYDPIHVSYIIGNVIGPLSEFPEAIHGSDPFGQGFPLFLVAPRLLPFRFQNKRFAII